MKEKEISFEDRKDFAVKITDKEVRTLLDEILELVFQIQVDSNYFLDNVIKVYACDYIDADAIFTERIYFNTSGIYQILGNMSVDNVIFKIDINVLRTALKNILADFKELSSNVVNFICISNFSESDIIKKCNEVLETGFKAYEKKYDEINHILNEKEKLLDVTGI